MLKEEAKNPSAEELNLAALEEKYEKELNEYEEKTHFMQDHGVNYDDDGSSSVKTTRARNNHFSGQPAKAQKHSQEQESASPISTSELLEKGAELVKEKSAAMWESIKSEWKRDRKEFVRKTLVGTAVTGAAIGLILLSRRKKQKTRMESLVSAL